MTLEETMSFAKTLLNTDLHDKEVFFDISRWTTFKPFSMLFIGAVMRVYRNKYQDIHFAFNHFKKEKYSYPGTMGFFKYIKEEIPVGKLPGESKGSQNYVPITSINFNELFENSFNGTEGNLIENEASKLVRIIDRGNEELHKLLTYLIREIIRNTFEHAGCNQVWICGQYWYSKDLAEIAILDEGKGILQSLLSNVSHRSSIKDNKSALEYAIKPGVSESFSLLKKPRGNDVWSNSGYGLYVVSEICKKLNGEFCLASYEDYMIINNKGQSFGKTSFNGTAIRIQLSPSRIDNAQEFISSISVQGEKEAKSIRNAFKKASMPSKGLMKY